MRSFLIACLGIFIILSISFAEEKGQEDYWIKLKKNIESIKQVQDDPTREASWKGEKLNQDIGVDELDMFNLALEYVINGNNDESLKTFYELTTKFPNSLLRDDAIRAMNKLLAMD